MERWAVTAHLRAAVSCDFQELCGFNSNSDEKELSSKAIEKNKKAVLLLVLTIKQFENPFAFNADSKKELHNTGTGSIVTKEMREDISNVKVCGKESTIKYLNERLKYQSVSFWDTLYKLQMKTFSTEEKPLKVIQKKKHLILLRLSITFL